MGVSLDFAINAVLLGCGATLLMDLWGIFQVKVLKSPVLSYAMVGRWIGHMPQKFTHDPIGKSPPVRGELLIGWIAHYVIGILFAAGMLLIIGRAWVESPTYLPALLVGIVTVLAPFFLLQPCFGAGIAASRTPAPNMARLKSIVTHAVFGTGLYLTGLLLSSMAVYP